MTQLHHGTQPRRASALLRALVGCVRVAGWACFGLVVAAVGFEHHPRLETWVEGLASEHLGGSLSSTVHIEDVDIRWLERSVRLRGVRMGPSGQELVADEIRLLFDPNGSGRSPVERVSVLGGALTITEDLARPIQTTEDSSSPLELLARSPEVVIRDFDVRVAASAGGAISIGTVDAAMTHENGEDARIVGRLTPALGVASDPSGVVWLEGSLDEGQLVSLKGVARALKVDLGRLAGSAGGAELRDRGQSPLALLAGFDPEGQLDLACDATYQIGSSMLPQVNAQIAIADGSLELPWLSSSASRRVRGVDLAAEIEFTPTPEDPMGRTAWSAQGELAAAWQQIQLTSGFRMGRFAPDGLVLDAWADMPDAELTEDLGELSAGDRGIGEIESMLQPRGRASVSVGVRLTEENSDRTDMRVDRLLDRFISIRPRGEASLAYHGSRNPVTRVKEFGFPLPVVGADGDVSWSIHPGRDVPYEGQLAIYDADARHSGGPLTIQASLHFVPLWHFGSRDMARLVPMPFHLRIESESLPVDAAFHRAFEGLNDSPEMAEILPTWNPSGGQIDFGLELWRTAEKRDMNMAIDAQVTGLNAQWKELAVPVTGVTGSLKVRSDGAPPDRTRSVVSLDLKARTSAASRPLSISGRVMGQGRNQSISWFQVDAQGVNPRSGQLRAELGRKNEEALEALEATGISEFLDVHVDSVQAIPMAAARGLRHSSTDGRFDYAGGSELWLDIGPHSDRSGLRIQPPKFNILTREAHGSLRIRTLLPPQNDRGSTPEADLPNEPATSIAARVQGLWRQSGPSVPVVARFSATPGHPARLEAAGAGLDIANDGLIGALLVAAREASDAEDGNADPIDTDAFQVTGRVDFEASFGLPEESGEELLDTHFGVEARLDQLAIGGSQVLEDVAAHVRFVEETGQWIGEEVHGRLGQTPVTLRNVAWTPSESGSTFRTRLDATDLPIDEEHLSFFLDPQTRRMVLEDLGARGRFDLHGTELTLERSDVGEMTVRLNGGLAISDAFVDLGVPIEISRVDNLQLDLTHEGRGLRAMASLEETYGTVAGRRLKGASFGLTYVEPRLVIESMTGNFEGGTLRAIDGLTSSGSNLLAIDLEPPFPFELSAELEDVDIGEFLRGVFDSDFANRGRMDLNMRLSGDFEHLTELEGRGSIRVEDSALWAIPVFQALSTRLGIDTTLLFRTMLCDYSVSNGELRLERMRVDSDLLSLVGQGAISFEGDVTSDLEVRYGLVDRLGPLTRLLYYIQNSLLRVSIRGTMERPTVVLRGLVSQLFSPDEERERLPLPGFSRRQRRF